MNIYRKILKYTTFFSLFFLSLPAMGQDPTPIKEGEIAPFSGTLLTDKDAAILLVKSESCDKKIELECTIQLENLDAKYKLSEELWNIQLQSERERYNLIVESQDRQLDYLLKANTKPAMSKEVAFIIGIGSGVILATASAYGYSLVAKANK